MRSRHQDEGGFALLVVFMLAAIIALFLYAQLPRVAFESERDKEQTLIDRGEQYKRAIQLYVIATKKFPQKLEDLENTNDKRYLRRRYIDPFTGKDEWRLIHVNAAGMLTDSLVQKPPTPDGKPATDGGPGSAIASATTTADPNAPQSGVNAAVRRRPSDVVGQAYSSPVATDPNDPATWAPITIGTQVGTGAAPTGQPPSGAVGFNGGLPGQIPGQNGQAGMMPFPGQPGFNPNQNQFKIDANGQLVPIPPNQPGLPQIPGQPAAGGGFQAPGSNPTGNSLAARDTAMASIESTLSGANPLGGGLGAAQGTTAGGIAGVASNYKGPSIKTYATRTKYQEWEFIYSMNNQQNGPGQNQNPLGGNQPGGQNGQTGQQPNLGGVPATPATTGNP